MSEFVSASGFSVWVQRWVWRKGSDRRLGLASGSGSVLGFVIFGDAMFLVFFV